VDKGRILEEIGSETGGKVGQSGQETRKRNKQEMLNTTQETDHFWFLPSGNTFF
jgi:hypothetical protein